MERYIDEKALQEAMCQDSYFKFLDGKYVYMPPFEMKPIEGYKEKTNFPNCCELHTEIYQCLVDDMIAFPDCCDDHRLAAQNAKFDLKHYDGFAEKIMRNIAYTEYHISQRINNEDWYKDICDYIEYGVIACGHPPKSTRIYLRAVQHYINNPGADVSINDLKKDKLNKHIDAHFERKETSKPAAIQSHLNILVDAYHKWHKLFPFDLPYFKPLKGYFKNTIPLLHGDTTYNPYTEFSKTGISTLDSLVGYLVDITACILQVIDTSNIYQSSDIDEKKGKRLALATEKYRVSQRLLFDKFSKGERKYVKTIKDWLKCEAEFYKELSDIETSLPIESEKTKVEKLREGLLKIGFDKLPKVKVLSGGAVNLLVKLISDHPLPYQIAMFDYLNFLEFLSEEYFDSKYKMHRELAKLLNTDERSIKGSINVLNPKSNENRQKYTSHLHKEIVEKDYQKLK